MNASVGIGARVGTREEPTYGVGPEVMSWHSPNVRIVCSSAVVVEICRSESRAALQLSVLDAPIVDPMALGAITGGSAGWPEIEQLTNRHLVDAADCSLRSCCRNGIASSGPV